MLYLFTKIYTTLSLELFHFSKKMQLDNAFFEYIYIYMYMFGYTIKINKDDVTKIQYTTFYLEAGKYIYIHIYTYMHICVYMYIYIYIYIY